MDAALWVAQVLLALAFLFSGYTHGIAYERTKERERMVWLGALPRWFAALIALLEILGAIGLIAPAATGILPWLTPLAALLLAVLMVFAVVFHLARRELRNIVLNVVLGLVAAFIAYGRFALSPF